jgi:hypothetical protein
VGSVAGVNPKKVAVDPVVSTDSVLASKGAAVLLLPPNRAGPLAAVRMGSSSPRAADAKSAAISNGNGHRSEAIAYTQHAEWLITAGYTQQAMHMYRRLINALPPP